VDAEDKALWRMIFPKAAFNSAEALHAVALAAVKSAVQQYTSQWKGWTDRSKREVSRRVAEEMAQMAGARMPAGLAESLERRAEAEVAKESPFQPTLKFSGGA